MDHKVFDLPTMQLRRILHDLWNIGSTNEISTPYFCKRSELLLRKCRTMGLQIRETNRIGRYIVSRIM